jgi:hypothetical protein
VSTVARGLAGLRRFVLVLVVTIVALWLIGLIVHAIVDLPDSGSKVIGW